MMSEQEKYNAPPDLPAVGNPHKENDAEQQENNGAARVEEIVKKLEKHPHLEKVAKALELTGSLGKPANDMNAEEQQETAR